MTCLLLIFVACGDDDSDFATRPSDASSSSGKEIAANSSSSRNDESSSSFSQFNPDIEYGELVDDRDGETYKTVKIGEQVWMAENLRFVTDSSYCFYLEKSDCAKYGRIYRWYAALGKLKSECGSAHVCHLPIGDIQGVCPSGWHLPSKTEWETLLNTVGGESVAGKKLKSMSDWKDYGGESGNGSDDFGFSALPAGTMTSEGYFFHANVGLKTCFWSSTQYDEFCAYIVDLSYSRAEVHLDYSYRDGAVSVRCVQDE